MLTSRVKNAVDPPSQGSELGNIGKYALLKRPSRGGSSVHYIINETVEYYECIAYYPVEGEFGASRLVFLHSELEILDSNHDVFVTGVIDKSTEPPITGDDGPIGYFNAALHDFLRFLNSEEFQESVKYPELVQTVATISSGIEALNSKGLKDIDKETKMREMMDLITVTNNALGLDHCLVGIDRNLDLLQMPVARAFKEYSALGCKSDEDLTSQGMTLKFRFMRYSQTSNARSGKIELEIYIYDPITDQNISESMFIQIGPSGEKLGNWDSMLSCALSKEQVDNLENLLLICRASRTESRSVEHYSQKSSGGPIKRQSSKKAIQSAETFRDCRIPLATGFAIIADCFKFDNPENAMVKLQPFSPEQISAWAKPALATASVKLEGQFELVHFSFSFAKNRIDTVIHNPNTSQQLQSGLMSTAIAGNLLNRLFVCVEDGQFSQLKGAADASIEIIMHLRIPKDLFSPYRFRITVHGNTVSEFRSIVLEKCPTPSWKELIQLDIDPEVFLSSHMFFVFRNLSSSSTQPFGFAYLPLMQNRSVALENASYNLIIYNYDSRSALPEVYLNHPHSKKIVLQGPTTANNIKLTDSGCTFKLKTKLLSSLLSQNEDAVAFIEWRRTGINRAPLIDVVRNLKSVPSEELISRCEDIYWAFVDMFFEMGPDTYAVLFDITLPIKFEVFHSFVIFLNTIYDKKYAGRLIEFESQIVEPSKYRSTLPVVSAIFTELLDNTDKVENQQIFVDGLPQAWAHLIRFVVRAAKGNLENITTSIQKIVGGFVKFFNLRGNETIRKLQSMSLEYLHQVFVETECIEEIWRLEFIKSLIGAIDLTEFGVRCAALGFVRELVELKLFSDRSIAASFRSTCLRWTFDCYRADPDTSDTAGLITRLLVSVLNEIETQTSSLVKSNEIIAGISVEMWNRMLYIMLKYSETYKFDNYTPPTTKMTTRTLSVHESLLVGFVSIAVILNAEYLVDVLKCARYNSSSVMVPRLMLRLLSLSECKSHLDWPNFNGMVGLALVNYSTALDIIFSTTRMEEAVWGDYLNFLSVLLTTPAIAIASQTFQRCFIDRSIDKSTVLRLVAIFKHSIQGLFDHRKKIRKSEKFPDAFLVNLLQHCLVRVSVIDHIATDLVFTTARATYVVDGHFRQIEKIVFELIHDDLIDRDLELVENSRYDYFFSSLEEFISVSDTEMARVGLSFLKALQKFEPLLTLESGMVQSENDVQACLKLLRFFKHIKHLSLYIRYVHELFNYHMKKKNYVESAIILYQEALLMGWDRKKAPEVSDAVILPSKITEFELNQQIHLMCIKLLDLDKNWERAIELTRVLEKKYEEAMDFQKLAEILQLRVTFMESILYEHRSFPTYYRIIFKGDGFPSEVRGKNFIYRGEDWEQIASFCDRLAVEYAPVRIVSSQSGRIHSKNDADASDRVIELNVVKPVSDLRNWCTKKENSECSGAVGAISWSIDKKKLSNIEQLPMWIFSPELYWEDEVYRNAVKAKEGLAPTINAFYDANETSMFKYSRPLNEESSSNPSMELTNTWTENTVMFAENQLPFVSRMTKVAKAIVFKTSPIENAIIAVRNVTKELVALHSLYRQKLNSKDDELRFSGELGTVPHTTKGENHPKLSMNPFTMKLSGVVDSPVNGGIAIYKRTFLSNPAYRIAENEPTCQKLYSSILDQVTIVQDCLDIHSELVSDEMRPHHLQLQNAFEFNYAEELATLKSTESTQRVSNLQFLRELTASNQAVQVGVLKEIQNSLYIPGVSDMSSVISAAEQKESSNRKKKHWSISALSFQSTAPERQNTNTKLK